MKILRGIALLCLIGLCSVTAQPLYEPEPPASSAFVRIVNASNGDQSPTVDTLNYDKLKPFSTSSYRVVGQGKHQVLWGSQKTELAFSAQKFYTLVVQERSLILIEDTAPMRTKALISVYNLSNLPLLTLKTNDNKVVIIADVKPNTVKSQPVNAIKIGFLLTQGATRLIELPSVQLERGLSYSVLAFNANKAIWLTNSTQK